QLADNPSPAVRWIRPSFICGGPEMAPALPARADNPLSAVGRTRPSFICGGPDMAPALPQPADCPCSADGPCATDRRGSADGPCSADGPRGGRPAGLRLI